MLKKILFALSIFVIGAKISYSIDNIGVEVDLLPFATGGNYIGAFVSENGFKYRFIRAESSMPDFMLEDGIDSVDLEVYAFIVDYYFDKTNYAGPWIGVGLEYWKNSIDEKNGVENVSLKQNIFTIGGGYLFKISQNLYINPWAAIHVDIDSNDYKMIGNTKYEIKDVVPEFSVKLTYYF